MSHAEIASEHFDDVLERRFGRRGALKAALAGAGGAAAAASIVSGSASAAGPYAPGELTYDAVAPNGDDQITLPAGFTHDIVISWGDPVVPGAPAFDLGNQTQAAQEMQCGFNHDYLAFLPLPIGSASSNSGLLWINHEYTDSTMMFESYTSTAAQVNVEIAAHGGSIVKVAKSPSGAWTYDPTSSYNRRIHGQTTFELTGPVAGDDRLKTTIDPTGRAVNGMLNNCGGGVTPWGTVLTCEENFDQYFGNAGASGANITDAYVKSTLSSVSATAGTSGRKWETIHPRFNLAIEPREYLKFGWVVEIDPYDPTWVPKKRTALGRFKHEAAAGTTSTAGKFVSYSGDDQVNNYIYKFVSAGSIDTANRANNANLLDTGTLYVAKFNADGSGQWLPLTFGVGPLVAPAFADQPDVLIRARQAATALGATKMARPEDVEVNPVTKKIYAVMTGNSGAEVNAANPRAGGSSIAGNGLGHVVEITETGGDNAALTFAWDIFLLCGYPGAAGSVATNSQPLPDLATTTAGNSSYWAGFDETKVSPVARVDNVSFDSKGNMFLSTDGQPSALAGPNASSAVVGWNDCLIGFPVEGGERGHGKAIMTGVDGCEMTGPFFTPDDTTLFASIQHPGVDLFTWTSTTTAPVASTGTFATPGSSWNKTAPIAGKTPGVPRPAAIAIRRVSGLPVAYGADTEPPVVPEFPMPAVAVGAAAVVGGLIAFRYRRMQPEGA
jgi:uncharacterized protein